MITKPPIISIGLPVYNGEKTITSVLDSIKRQTLTDYELIISNNNSSDKTEEICLKYAENDKRIKYHKQIKTINAFDNFKFVLYLARGEYFMWAAADDIRSDNFIEENYNFLKENNDYVASISPVRFEDGHFDKVKMGDKSIGCNTYINRIAEFFNCWHANGRFYSLIRKNSVQDVDLSFSEFMGFDWLVVLKLLKYGKMKRINSGELILGSHGESNGLEVFNKYKKMGFYYYLFPFSPLFSNVNQIIKGAPIIKKIKIYIEWVKLTFNALILNALFNLKK